MGTRLIHILLIVIIALQMVPVHARSGDTLEPIEIEAPTLQTYPDNLLAESDFDAIASRVREARDSGVPVAIRIVDMSLPATDLPFPLRQYAREDFTQPISAERQEAMTAAWSKNESIETSEDANDGFLLLVLVPADRTQTQAVWWTGDNALPLNGLTEQNILATQQVMNEQFAEGNMPNGVFLGISEFSYNVQFGVPERLERSRNISALHTAMIPLAIGTVLAGLMVPVLAWRLSRRNSFAGEITSPLTPWEAAALHLRRATPAITAAMLLDAAHTHTIVPGTDGSVRLEPGEMNAAVETLRPFANSDGVVPANAMREVQAITAPVREEIENSLAESGAMTSRVRVDRTWMLLAMALAVFVLALAVVPTVASMSASGVFAISLGAAGVMSGWWWLSHRSYTSPAGALLLESWLENASAADRHLFDTAIHLDVLTDQSGGPDVNHQMQLVRQLRGLSAG